MPPFKKHLIYNGSTIREALKKLDQLAEDAILFVVDSSEKLLGSLTDGDVRRALINGKSPEDNVMECAHKSPRYIEKGNYNLQDIIQLRNQNIKVFPVLSDNLKVINIINLNRFKSYLPVDVIIMAGGRGSRLRPLTDSTPKPLLKVGEKPIIEHNFDRLCSYGVDDFWITLRYLGDQIIDYMGDGSEKGVRINYIWEEEPMGTIGSVSLIENLQHDYVLVTNSDLLTTLDYEDFFVDFIENEADIAVATIPYSVDVPYAVLETENNRIKSFQEKPTYTYYSNAGIYLIKRRLIDMIPKGQFYNSTDLLEAAIEMGKKAISFPMTQYWLDIGKQDDFNKAQRDINKLK